MASWNSSIGKIVFGRKIVTANCGAVELTSIRFPPSYASLTTRGKQKILIEFIEYIKKGKWGYDTQSGLVFMSDIKYSSGYYGRTSDVIEAVKRMKRRGKIRAVVTEGVINPNSGNKIYGCVIEVDGAHTRQPGFVDSIYPEDN